MTSIDIERLRECMRVLGISQAELSRATGISQQSIHNILAGRCGVSPISIKEIARAVQMPVAYLLRHGDDGPQLRADVDQTSRPVHRSVRVFKISNPGEPDFRLLTTLAIQGDGGTRFSAVSVKKSGL